VEPGAAHPWGIIRQRGKPFNRTHLAILSTKNPEEPKL
jgi:hypothetical protein